MRIAFVVTLIIAVLVGISIAVWMLNSLGKAAFIFAIPFLLFAIIHNVFRPKVKSRRR